MSLRVFLVYQSPVRLPLLREAVATAGYEAIAAVPLPELDVAAMGRAEALLIDLDIPDAALFDQLHGISQSQSIPIVIFAAAGDREIISEATNAGVTSYVVDGLSPRRLSPIVEAARARFQAFESLRKELQETKNKLEDRRHIDKAKGILMQQKGISEDAAYKALRKLAMDRNIRIGEAACNVIAMAELFG